MSTRLPTEDPAPPLVAPRSRRRPVAAVVLVAAVTAAAGLLRALSAPATLVPAFQDGITLAVSVLVESFPFVVLGIVLAIVIQIWMPATWIARALPRNPLARRAIVSLLGMFFPVCECGNLPMARGFLARGVSVPESITFLAAAPILNPITIVTTQQAFGWDGWMLGGRILGGFIVANLLGWIFSRHARPESLLTPSFAAECRLAEHDHGGRLERSARQFGRECAAIMPALLAGAVVAALVQIAVPRDVLVAVGANPLLSVAAMIALAFAVAVCSNVDAFFVLAFGSAFLPGSVLAFLIFGPIMDIKMFALLRTTFTRTTVLRIAVVAALVAAALGTAVNLVA